MRNPRAVATPAYRGAGTPQPQCGKVTSVREMVPKYHDAMVLCGLEKAKELNNRAAWVCKESPRDDGRVGVKLFTPPFSEVWVKQKNLVQVLFPTDLKYTVFFASMPNPDFVELTLHVRAMKDSVPIPGIPGSVVSTMDSPDTLPASTHLTPIEKSELLRVGCWGDSTNAGEWSDLLHLIKNARSGVYPPDWPEQVIDGNLFKSNDQPFRSGMQFAKVTNANDFFNDITGKIPNPNAVFSMRMPCYEVCEKIASDADILTAAEYGILCHDELKKMFTSAHDPDVVRKAGLVISEAGGTQAMAGACYCYHNIMLTLAFNQGVNDTDFKAWWEATKRTINLSWDGIAGWPIPRF